TEAGKQNVRIVLEVPPQQVPAEAVVGKPAPEFAVRQWWPRRSTGGGKFARDEFRGKVVLLAFTDEAKPSQRLMPALNRLAKKLSDQRLVIVRVYQGEIQEPDAADALPAAVVAPGTVGGGQGEVFRKYGIRAVPTLFLIDRQGVLRFADVEPDALEGRVEE